LGMAPEKVVNKKMIEAADIEFEEVEK